MTRSKIYWNTLCCLLSVHLISAQGRQLDDLDDENVGVGIGNARQEKELYKGFSGFHLFSNATQRVYHHDLTIAVVEITRNNTLMNCELIEVFNDEQQHEALRNLTIQISKPIRVTFNEIMELMSRCGRLDQNLINRRIAATLHKPPVDQPESETTQSSILSGIVPGTKWCGTGDIAKTYFDLGSEVTMDKCCRAHDLCPVKVRGYSARYNLTNESLYTKSHCSCDDELLKCLRSSNKPAANFMANIYFNILRIPCIVDEKEGKKRFRSAKRF
ncbi:group 3 secretory phospholipase A2-like [Planococcus citri]|uniref:group 3 secretory phospholipase A2-like n=1 Tax=Planococcus citri TaxID=170843 RepID=UPI0031F7C79B